MKKILVGLTLSLTLIVGCGAEAPIAQLPTIPSFTSTSQSPKVDTDINSYGNPSPSDQSQDVVKVVKIVDGDTIDLNDGRRVRILGIDTPERGQCGFAEATAFARVSLLNKQVVVSLDPTQDTRDRYNRWLMYVVVNEQDYSTDIARSGWAKAYVYANKPVQKHPLINSAVNTAKAQGLGIWGSCITRTMTTSVQPIPKTKVPAPTTIKPAPIAKATTSKKPVSIFYKNCTEVKAAGKAPIRVGQPGWQSKFDRDGDGIGCE